MLHKRFTIDFDFEQVYERLLQISELPLDSSLSCIVDDVILGIEICWNDFFLSSLKGDEYMSSKELFYTLNLLNAKILMVSDFFPGVFSKKGAYGLN